MSMLRKSIITMTATSIVSIGSAVAAPIYQDNYQSKSTASTTLLKDKQFNIELNILQTILGCIAGSLNYKLKQDSAIGINAGYQVTDSSKKMYNVGLTYNYAFNGDYMSTGWIAKPYIAYGYYKNTSTFDPMDSNGVAAGATITYKWMSDHGFNWQLGVGAFYSSVKLLSLQDKDGHKGVGLIGEFSMGMAL
ncbi:hypothetical protein N9Y17_00995 [Gammaproteobacteria bacterium]|nr:hypothetical protein [Gammaproteobacteria bacterium]